MTRLDVSLALLALLGLVGAAPKSWVDPLSVVRHGPQPPSPPRGITEHWITQKLDHFNVLDNRTWQQRYFVNDDYFSAGGPVFLFLNGEWEASGGFTNIFSFMGRLAFNAGALAIDLEHRYYGRSRPTADLSTENLRYLSVDQALADAAHFAETLQTEHGFTGRWVVFGVSYSATLAGWARASYPHLFYAAYSSSGPVLAKVDFYEYHEGTGEAMALTDPECPIQVRSAMDELQQLIAEGGDSLAYVERIFNICPPGLNASSPLDVMTLNSMVANFFGGLVQYAGPDGQNYSCTNIMHGPGSPLENMADMVTQAYQGMCLTTDYELIMEFYRSMLIEHDPLLFVRQWVYQSCMEFGWFWSLSSPNQPFGQLMFVEYFTGWCAEIFGPEYTHEVVEAGVSRTNLVHGALTPEVSRLLYVHGSLDQWAKLGVNEDLGPDTRVIMIEGGSHSWDMAFNSTSDPPELVAAREQAAQILEEWLQRP